MVRAGRDGATCHPKTASLYRGYLERAGDQQVDQDDDAKSQDEKREFLDFQSVFARRGFGRHDAYQFRPERADWEWLRSGWHRGNVPKVCEPWLDAIRFLLSDPRLALRGPG